MKKYTWFFIGMLVLVGLEVCKVYFIMPFPGSQKADTVGLAYFIDHNIWWLRLLVIILIVPPAVLTFREGNKWRRWLATALVIIYALVFYAVQFRFLADKIFLPPKVKAYAQAVADTNKNKLVIGIYSGNEARAYPVEVIGYHHQVRDSLAGEPIMVTYCTVCRTGRVYSPVVNGRNEQFRLVGMDHFNAMFEDASTRSWWRQATGEAIKGPMKGYHLREIASEQMRLGDWLYLHPESLVMLPDSNFRAKYDSLKGFDEGTLRSRLEKRDSASWHKKSWVIGVVAGDKARAYDWTGLTRSGWMEDKLGEKNILVTIEPMQKTHYVLDREIDGRTLHFYFDSVASVLRDKESGSAWAPNGMSVDGSFKGKQLRHLQSYQEFWHSWKQFHPTTDTFATRNGEMIKK